MRLPPSSYNAFAKFLPRIPPLLAGPVISPSYTVLPSSEEIIAFNVN